MSIQDKVWDGREAAIRLRKMKRNLFTRQRRLMQNYRARPDHSRRDPRIQLELRRVAALCFKLGEKLHSFLEREVLAGIMES